MISPIFLGPPPRARAWSDAPLCVAQPPQLSEYAEIERGDSLLCEPPEEAYVVQQGPLWTAPITGAEARRALQEADELAVRAPVDALLKLRLVERAMPRIQDRLAMERAEVLMRLDRTSEACDAFRLAADSIEPNIAAEARIGLARCMLQDGKKQGELELDKVCRRYPRLGERYELQYELARARERWNNLPAAIGIYRTIDLQAPETHAALLSREALERLREQGVKIQPYTPAEIVGRAERMVERGSVEAGRNAVNDLLAMTTLPLQQQGRSHILAARVARMEGNWEVVREQVTKAINVGIPAGDAQRFLPRLTVEKLEPGQGEARVRKVLGGRKVKQLTSGQLRGVLDIAIQFGLREVASEAIEAMTARATRVPPPALFEACVLASGVASDESLAAAFDSLREQWGMKAASTYYHARALENLGRVDEARAEYRTVIEIDDGSTRYYATWSQARLSGFEQLAAGSCPRDLTGNCAPDIGLWNAPPALSAERQAAPSALGPLGPPSVSAVFGEPSQRDSDALELANGLPNKNDVRREAIVARLRALAGIHGAAYPWLARAADLAELERYDDAAAEISELFLTYQDARGGLRMRVGAEAVLTNALSPRRAAPGNLRRDRLALDEWARMSLAEVADMLGEPGVALRLRDLRGEPRPRAYALEVERAAAKFGVDPNLLFAVMRVESVYYRHIVSHAGAVGLMQIMPLTGKRIARALGIADFNPRELLDPRRNLEFGAWYLASLIRRFDGRMPLAIAAYNGGPHNVRLWLNAHPNSMPLDAFLERIPFTETHRYVRRVLTNYAAYRAQQNLSMPNLAVTMPRPRPDTIAF